MARLSGHIQDFPGPETASLSRHGFPFILWPLGFLRSGSIERCGDSGSWEPHWSLDLQEGPDWWGTQRLVAP